MEVASAASTPKVIQVLANLVSQKPTNSTTLNPRRASPKPQILAFSVPNPVPGNSRLLFLTHCSRNPGTCADNETAKNSTIHSKPNPKPRSTKSPVSNSLSSSMPLPSFSTGLVFDIGAEDSWDSKGIGSPVVKRFCSDEEERWYMWYHGHSSTQGSDSMGLAVSINGIHWERGVGPVESSGDVGLVMNCSQDWWAFDTMSIRPSEVVVMSSAKVRAFSAIYWLYYTGFNSEKVYLENPERFSFFSGNGGNERIFKSLPGLAISQDGRHWARIEGEHHSGALFDVGSKGDWDSLFIASPQVVFHESGDLRMYYHSFDAEKGEFGIGIARSRDGINWVKLGKIIGGGKIGSFDEFGAINPCVVRNRKDGNYVMVYEGIAAGGQRSIGLAVSPDGLKEWSRPQDVAVLKPSLQDGWDSKGVGSPYLVQMDGGDIDEWRLYYTGIGNEGRTGIGMAVSQGNDISSFRRWAGFQL